MAVELLLRWNDYQSNLSQSFNALLEDQDLVDVTLAAGSQYFHAHKLILSVSSPYFKELFKMNPCDHPIVILKDVKPTEVYQLLQFMYKGEVNVQQQELSGFLQTAEMLRVKGLSISVPDRSDTPPPTAPVKTESNTVTNNDAMPTVITDTFPCENSDSPSDSLPTLEEEANNISLKRRMKQHKTNHNAKKRPNSNIKTENSSPLQDNLDCSDGELQIDFDDRFHSILGINDPPNESIILKSKHEGGWNCKSGGVKCPSCNRFFANRYNLKVHIRDKHDTLEGTLQCEICQKRMRNPSCLRVHMYHHRKQAAYLAAQMTGLQEHPNKQSVSDKWCAIDSSPRLSMSTQDWPSDLPAPIASSSPTAEPERLAIHSSGSEEGNPPKSPNSIKAETPDININVEIN